MQQSEVREFLSTRVGTDLPVWSLSHDSNALSLAKDDGPAALAVDLDAGQAQRLRLIGEGVQRMSVGLRLAGESFQLHLVGLRISEFEWAGIGSADPGVKATAEQLATLKKRVPDNVVTMRSKRFA